MATFDRVPFFLVAGAGASGTNSNTAGLETSATFTGSGFTSGELGFFIINNTTTSSTNVNTTGTITTTLPFFAAVKTASTAPFPTGKLSRRSPEILGKNIKRLTRKLYTTPVAETWTIGFDGVSSVGLTFNCDSDYGIRIIAYSKFIREFYNNQGFVQTYNIHTECCDDCAGCDTADCLAASAQFVNVINSTNQGGIPARFFYAVQLANGVASDVATGLAAGTATFVQNSPVVTFSVNQTIASGAYIRVDAVDTTQTALTDSVFKVLTGVTAGTSITLDTPWLGASTTRTLTTSASTSAITIVTPSAVTACGVKVIGNFLNPQSGCCCFPPFPYDVDGVTFIVTKDAFNSFPCAWDAAIGTSLSYGSGSALQMQYMEMEAFGYTDVRQWFLDCAANVVYPTKIIATDTYDLYTVEWDSSYPTTEQSGNTNVTGQILYIAVTNTTSGTAGSTTGTAMNTAWTSLATLSLAPYVAN